MKTIVKSSAHPCLESSKDKGLTWDVFVKDFHDDYLCVREQALIDQKNECAYSGLWLGTGTHQKIHLDHFRKKAIYQELVFNWDNLFAAAKDLEYGSDHKDKKIHGPRTNADAQYKTFFSPLEANLEEMFWYRQDGKIVPHPNLDIVLKNKLKQTINVYNLNDEDLKKKRAGLIAQLRGLKDLDDDTIRQCMDTQGFSFVVEFELRQRKEHTNT